MSTLGQKRDRKGLFMSALGQKQTYAVHNGISGLMRSSEKELTY